MVAPTNLNILIATQFTKPVPNEPVTLLMQLRDFHPSSQHVSVTGVVSSDFPVSAFLRSVDVPVAVLNDPASGSLSYSFFEYQASKKEIYSEVMCGCIKFSYQETDFTVYKAIWNRDHSPHYFFGLVFDAPDETPGKDLARAVYKWANDLKEEVWVFDNGRWSKNKDLYKAVQAAEWNDVLFLGHRFKNGLRRDTETFFANRQAYETLNITWKRGILLLGPPGNGKTESIKALLNETRENALYVKSFTTPHGPEYGVRTIFDHARMHSPCILVLEDLDSMVTSKARSFFLNELDGLAKNEGILTIATTNHPENIDDAILNRPSRFDVKYNYGLPVRDLRKEFAIKWIKKVRAVNTDMGGLFETDEESVAESVADKSDGWSFAFLKELFVSLLLRIAHDKGLGTSGTGGSSMQTILFDQLEHLSSQIIKINAARGEKKDAEVDGKDTWCPAIESDDNTVHEGVNF